MSQFAVEPSLASLPLELIGFIAPYSTSLDVSFEDDLNLESLADLRALSQTCRRLRDFLLPHVWSRIEVTTLKELGGLRELLISAPSITSLIRSFRFLWNMDGQCSDWHLAAFEGEEGTALDLAFCDRLQIFSRLMKEEDADVEYDTSFTVAYCGYRCEPPGYGHDWAAIKQLGPAEYDWLAGTGGKGPDGEGEDKFIKNAEQFTECIIEVVSLLPSLETFGWETEVTPMPRGVFDALARLTSLTDLRLRFSSHRGNLTNLPLWKLAGGLKALLLDQGELPGVPTIKYRLPYEDADETKETTLEAIEAHPQAPSAYLNWFDDDEQQAREAVHVTIATRTIIAAAQGGQLKRLNSGWPRYQYHSKIRSLLPSWVRIEDWGEYGFFAGHVWEGAAFLLRPFFAHASRRQDWLTPQATSAAQLDRTLTHEDLHEMQSYYDGGGELERWGPNYDESEKHTFEPVFLCYLPWLIEDAELAQQVLDIWNSIAERGEADKVECPCNKCQASS